MTVSLPHAPPGTSTASHQPARDFAEFYAARFRGLTVALYAYTGDLAAARTTCRRRSAGLGPGVRLRRPECLGAAGAWNLAVSRWRRVRRDIAAARGYRQPVVEGPTPDRVALVAALATLPPRYRRAVVLFHLADLPVAEIAAQEGVAEGTVRVWLHRGRIALSAQLSETPSGEHHD